MAVSRRVDQTKWRLDWSRLTGHRRGGKACHLRITVRERAETLRPQWGKGGWKAEMGTSGPGWPAVNHGTLESHFRYFNEKNRGCRRPRPLKRRRPSKQVSTESKCSSYAKPKTAPNAPETADGGDSVGSESAAPAGELERWNIDAFSSPRRSLPDPIHSGLTRKRPNRLSWGRDPKAAPSLLSFPSQKSWNRPAALANLREVPAAAEPEPSMPLRRPRGWIDGWRE